MILADKIIRLRKKNGWSQEELADKMNVSRQAVSKWESAQYSRFGKDIAAWYAIRRYNRLSFER